MRTQSTALLVLLSSEFGCSEHKVGRFNSLPEATITSHSDGASVFEGETITLSGRVSDPDHAMEDLLASWRIGDEEVCEETAPSDSGASSCEVQIDLESTEVILEVRDPESGAATASIELDVHANQAPTAEILNPTSSTAWYVDSLIDFDAQVNDSEDQPEDLALIWSSDVDGDLEIDAEPDGTGSAVGVGSLSEGEHRITLTVTDTMGKSVSETTLIEVSPPNTEPECSISSPFDGTLSELGEDLVFLGVAWDEDTEDLTSLETTWRSDLDGLLASINPDDSGVIRLTVDTLSRGSHEISLSVSDGGDTACTDTVAITIASPPEVSISSPVSGEIIGEEEAISLIGTVSDGDQDPETLSITWSSDLDGTISSEPADTDGLTEVTVETLSRGEHTLTLTASDDHGLSTEETVSLTVNGAPTTPEVSISPNPSTTSDDLEATIDVESTDPEGDPITYSYAWTQDGTATSDTSPTISSSDTHHGETWEVTVTPDDGLHAGPSSTSAITIDNTAPEIVSLSLSPLAVYTDDSLTVTVVTQDADGDAVSVSYLWEVDGVAVTETSATLDGRTDFDRDQVVQVTVTPNDGSVDGASMSDSITVLNTVPEATSVEISPTELFTDDDANAVVTGSDADGDSVSYSYDWYVDGALVSETSATLSGTDNFDKGQLVAVIVTPDDGTDTGSSATSSTITVSNTLPVISDLTLSPDPVGTDDTLQATPTATDADGDTLTYSWSWEVSGTVSSETTDELDGSSEFDKGDTIIATAIPHDGEDSGDAFSSDSITVGNAPPELTSVTLSPSAVYTDDAVTASASTTDGDGDSVSLSYYWEVDGLPVAETSDTLDGAAWFDRDQVVTVTVTPNDGVDDGATLSDSITILNTAPVGTSATLSPTELFTDDEARAVVSGTDDDGDGLSYSYEWYVDGALVTETSATLSGVTDFDKDQLVYVVATPDDGTDTGSSATSSTVTVSNTPPVISDITFTPNPVTTDDLLLASPSATDADGDSVTYSWAWEISGTASSETTDSLDGATEFDKGDTIVVTAIPDDGDDTGDAFSSETLTVGNAPPELLSGSLSPSVVYTDDTITASVSTTDDDGDAVTIAYAWTVDGTLISPTTNTLYGPTWFDKDQEVGLEVDLTDASGDTATYAVGTVTISNTPPGDPVVTLSPEEPRDGTDDLVCEITTEASDVDLDSLTYTFSWEVDGSPWTGTTESTTSGDDTIPGTETDSGELWTCTATADDGDDSGGSDSDSVTIIEGFSGWESTSMSAEDADYAASGEDGTDYAGYAVAGLGDLDGDGYDDIIIGGYGADDAGTSTGMGFILMGDGLSSTREIELSNADYRLIGESLNDYAGKVVAPAGDVDGDGYPDILITAYGDDTYGSNAGKVYLFFSNQLSTAADLYLYDADHMFFGEASSDAAGSAAASAGDVDGDGCDDLIIGAYGNDDGGSNAGAAYLWLCASLTSEDLELGDADVIFYGDASGDSLGRAVAGRSDIDGDGYDDVIIGADGADGGGSGSGEAYLYSAATLDTGTLFASDADIVFVGEDTSDGAGYTLALPGDVDGDEGGDVLIGAYGDDSGGTSAGKTYLFFSESLPSSGTVDLYESDHAFIGEAANDSSSIGLSGAGDVDRDGLADILIGSPMNDNEGSNSGTAYLILSDSLASSRNIDLSSADYAFTGENLSDQHGRAVSGAGDVNGDELDDFLIGAPYNDTGGSNAGAVYLWLSD